MSLCPHAAAQALRSPPELQQHEHKHSPAYFDDLDYPQYKLQTSNPFGLDQEPLLDQSSHIQDPRSTWVSRYLAFGVNAASSRSRHVASEAATASPSRKAWLPVLLIANLAITVVSFIAACIHYNTFTTLFLYLALLIVAFPILSLSLFVVNRDSKRYDLQIPSFSSDSTPLSEQSFRSGPSFFDRSFTHPPPTTPGVVAITRRGSCRPRHLQSFARAAQYVGAVLWFIAIVEWIFFQPFVATRIATTGDEMASYINASPATHATPVQPIKVFIVSNLYNSQEILPAYASSLKSLVNVLGADNVFVSLYESHSTDQTKHMLAQLDQELAHINVSRRILTDDRAMRMGKMSAVSDRIKYLADVRNTAMQPLIDAAGMYTHVLWINDIVFTPQDALELLYTNQASYDQVCAMDFLGNGFYDTWVTRDAEGETLKRQWPYFKRAEDVEAMRRGTPFEVNSCWNGMSAFDAKWFYPSANGSSTFKGVDDEDGPLSLPLLFRSSSACLSSECQLISYDIHRATHSTGRRPTILINPAVKVAYNHRHYFLYGSLIPSPILRPWRIIWRDYMAYRWFGWVTERQRWSNECKAKQKYWAAPASQSAVEAV